MVLNKINGIVVTFNDAKSSFYFYSSFLIMDEFVEFRWE